MPEGPIGEEDAAVETAGDLGCKVGIDVAPVAAGEAVAPRHRQRGSRQTESNRRSGGGVDEEVGRTVGELRLGWRNGKCQVPVGCHMSIAGDDGRDPKREQLDYLRRSGYEDHWEDNEAVVERVVDWIGRRRRKGAVHSEADSGVGVGGSLPDLMDLECNICQRVVGLMGLGAGIHQSRTHIVAVLDGHTEVVLAVTLMPPIATHNLCGP